MCAGFNSANALKEFERNFHFLKFWPELDKCSEAKKQEDVVTVGQMSICQMTVGKKYFESVFLYIFLVLQSPSVYWNPTKSLRKLKIPFKLFECIC